jgi:hypothetical protein
MIASLVVTAFSSAGVEALPATAPISGFLWSMLVPALLFVTALGATCLLYRHFAGRDRRQ